MIVTLDPDYPNPKWIQKAADILKEGGVIAYPTDTHYGIGCDLTNKKAIERIYRIKKMNRKKPLSFICNDFKDLSQYAVVSNYAFKMMKKLLPGPYTFVLKATRYVPKTMVTKQKTVGIRIPDNEICLKMVEFLGGPVVNTSVRVKEGQIFTDPMQIEENLGSELDMILHGGVLVSEPSTVISLVGEEPEILREGKGDITPFL